MNGLAGNIALRLPINYRIFGGTLNSVQLHLIKLVLGQLLGTKAILLLVFLMRLKLIGYLLNSC
jgi:hypothetical protein